jgi:myo-inositol 2-dehydrogenase/D-chiro-inositol 1-dehydrogenase
VADANVAIIGAGRMGRVHIRAVRAVRGARVSAVVEPNAEARARLGGEVPGLFGNLDELLSGSRPDGAVVAVPSSRHLDVVSRLLSEGIPTFCEKPCGIARHEAAAIAKIADTTGTPLTVGYWRRFVPALRELRVRLLAGELGQIQLLLASQWDEHPPELAFRQASGGITVDMGVHEFDQIRWLTSQEFGEWTGVAATVGAALPFAHDPESVQLVSRLSGGGVAVVSLGRRFPPGDTCRLEIHGTEAFKECRFMWPPNSEQVFFQGITAQAEAFIALINGAAPIGATIGDAVEALATAEQAAAALSLTFTDLIRT